VRETNWTGRLLRYGRSQNLKYIIPIQMLISIDSLRLVVSIRFDNEPIIGMNVSCFIGRMMTRPNAIDVTSPGSSTKSISIVLWSRWKSEIHKMGDGGLTTAAVDISHGSLVLSVGA
jgi:hypothetical protein